MQGFNHFLIPTPRSKPPATPSSYLLHAFHPVKVVTPLPSGALHMFNHEVTVACHFFPVEDSSFKAFSPKTQMDGLLGRALIRNKCFEHVELTYKGKYKHLEFFH